MRRPKVYSWISKLEIRCKIISIMAAAFLLITLEEPIVLGIVLVGLWILARQMGLPWKFLIRKLGLPLPFLLFMSIPLMLGEGFPVSADRLIFAYQLITKGLGVFMLLIILTYTQEEVQLVEGIRQLPIPKTLSAVLLLSFRYIHVWTATLKKTYRSSVSRGFEKSWHPSTLKVYGEIMGAMILRSMDQSQRVHRTMVSRGFSRDLPKGPPKALGIREGLWVFSLMIGFILLKALEMML
ncbi:energy-coupling factor transporter transmembrane component T family protein [Isachenkonia alkalipeptolytica]|uniref:Cobalt ECF transporter T component CbiQ n=1 Tax=Isachenkonia alkalipeptolytica TaxID=2565777 RepID=A0AA43XHS7_9CLOT|nr:energy-coupling factor transporter transmembrane component T [Isachenkonia alkalipeptolytica]NBG87100.1 hypothetical protein [Isachenkonia alkalipeptolytica]